MTQTHIVRRRNRNGSLTFGTILQLIPARFYLALVAMVCLIGFLGGIVAGTIIA